MLEKIPTCRICNKSLPFDSQEEMICTFCKECVETTLQQACLNK
ncbi:DUF1272 domain-containing protein [Flavivirga spongiicola]|uniref:DUF1272 domain-containing protein n=1 Tax=Flavivirga spongiicola TaxID=421621 RepID=A0ABU7XP03_9FLAO|nr:DUF1272 domain-containing protein [Flavivirga sp. MEBiC05379]MDO5977498.1 DUF1272 domain-containing protein [Flavivirga sp. MEBiC05379]